MKSLEAAPTRVPDSIQNGPQTTWMSDKSTGTYCPSRNSPLQQLTVTLTNSHENQNKLAYYLSNQRDLPGRNIPFIYKVSSWLMNVRNVLLKPRVTRVIAGIVRSLIGPELQRFPPNAPNVTENKKRNLQIAEEFSTKSLALITLK